MPVYEYRCQKCRHKVSVFFRSLTDTKTPMCEHCGSTELFRLVSQIVVHKSWGDSVNFPGSEALDAADENNPAEMKEWMMRMKRELGDSDPSMSEADYLDAGIDPHGEHGMGPDHDAAHGAGGGLPAED